VTAEDPNSWEESGGERKDEVISVRAVKFRTLSARSYTSVDEVTTQLSISDIERCRRVARARSYDR